jgi:hypothetical protein
LIAEGEAREGLTPAGIATSVVAHSKEALNDFDAMSDMVTSWKIFSPPLGPLRIAKWNSVSAWPRRPAKPASRVFVF